MQKLLFILSLIGLFSCNGDSPIVKSNVDSTKNTEVNNDIKKQKEDLDKREKALEERERELSQKESDDETADNFIGTWQKLGNRPYGTVSQTQLIISKSGRNFTLRFISFYESGEDEKKSVASYNKGNGTLEISSGLGKQDVIYDKETKHLLFGSGTEWEKIN